MVLGFGMCERRQERRKPSFLGSSCGSLVLTFIVSGAFSDLSAQPRFYPDSTTVWCGIDDLGGPPLFDFQLEMGSDPDTVINGVVYKRIVEYNNSGGSWGWRYTHFVRNGEGGKGYVYIPDLMEEFLTGDVGAVQGDTVHNVVEYYPPGSGAGDIGYYVRPIVVIDSVVTYSNDGVTVTRHYMFSEPGYLFWQAGMGASGGAMIRTRGFIRGCQRNDTVQFNALQSGSPGGPLLCGPTITGLTDRFGPMSASGLIHPNPSNGRFNLMEPLPSGSTVYDMQGAVVLRLLPSNREIDLTGHPPGVYLAEFHYGDTRLVQRLVVVP